MAKRCDNCKHWTESVFLGSSASGYGCWEGHCHHPKVPAPRVGERPRHNLMLACQHFEEGAHPLSLEFKIRRDEQKEGRHDFDDDAVCKKCGFDGAEWHHWRTQTYEGKANPDAKQPLCSVP